MMNDLIEQSKKVMSDLKAALQEKNVPKSRAYLSQAVLFRDAFESKMTPNDFEQGADLLEIKGLLDDAINEGTVKLDTFFVSHGGNPAGLFGDSYSSNNDVNGLDIEFGIDRPEF